MFNLSIPATRTTPATFWQVSSFTSVFGVRMVNVFAVGKKFKIFQPIVGPIKIFMVNFKTPGDDAVKGFPNKPVHRTTRIRAVFAQAYCWVMLHQNRFKRSRRFIAIPRLSMFNGKHGGYASVQERCDICHFASAVQHLFSLDNLFRGKFFPPRGSTHIAKIADFVQCFVSKHRFPNFHKMSPLTSYNPIPNLIKGQA